MKKTTQLGLLVVLIYTLFTGPLSAQNLEKEASELAKKYEKAYNKEDVKALLKLFTADAVRSYSDGRLYTGIAEIEAAMTADFSANSLQLSIQPGGAEMNSDGTATAKGTYKISGTVGSGETIESTGSYTNTLIKSGGGWLLSKSVIVSN